jgi:hypothetical protein
MHNKSALFINKEQGYFNEKTCKNDVVVEKSHEN